ncbi:MAG TPA: glycosyltransferase [Pyrinomonadaceae bacterium]|nr:glycosyltransferase [Pyrinomonadaceae bacterium]
MKVLHVIPSISKRSGGPAHAILPMCKALQRAGLDVTLATTDHDLENADSRQGDLSTLDGVPVHIFAAQLGDSFKYSRPFSSWLNSEVENFDLVHIHAVFNHSSIAAARACTRKNVPYIVRPLGTLDPWSMKQKPIRKRLFLKLGARRLLTNAGAIQYTTEAEKSSTEAALRLNHGIVVPLGIEEELSGVEISKEQFGKMFPTLQDRPYILVLSRLHSQKNIDALLRAFITVSARPNFSQWQLVIGGDGNSDYVAQLKRLVGANDRVLFTGWLEAVAKYAILRNASLLALTSFQESFGLCLLEAMACGVPVLVGSNVKLAADIDKARAGWITEPQLEAITQALSTALENPTELKTRGMSGVAFARSFTWESVGISLSSLYSSVVNQSRL